MGNQRIINGMLGVQPGSALCRAKSALPSVYGSGPTWSRKLAQDNVARERVKGGGEGESKEDGKGLGKSSAGMRESGTVGHRSEVPASCLHLAPRHS